jgi:hypothetical protein
MLVRYDTKGSTKVQQEDGEISRVEQKMPSWSVYYNIKTNCQNQSS